MQVPAKTNKRKQATGNPAWKPGGPSPNPSGLALPERRAQREISEALRELVEPAALGRAMLAIFAGHDPFPKGGNAGSSDGVPQFQEPIDWQHRIAALKLFMEYGFGKPQQGHVVVADIRSTHVHREAGPVDVRSMTPETRAMIAAAARAVVMGQLQAAQAGNVAAVGGVAHALVDARAELPADHVHGGQQAPLGHAEHAAEERVGLPPAEELDDDELEGDEPGPVGEDVGFDVGDPHATTVALEGADVNAKRKEIRHPGVTL